MKLILIIIIAFTCQFAFSRTIHNISFTATTQAERSIIANFIHIDLVTDQAVYSTINDFDYQRIKQNIPFLITSDIPFTIDEKQYPGFAEYEFPAGDEAYHTYDEIIESLTTYSKKYPSFVEYFSLGKSFEGRDIPAIKISNKNKSNLPGILFTGSHHAREHLSTEVPMLLIKHLIENYNSNQRIQTLIDNREIVFAPLINPDGALYDIKDKQYRVWRKNMHSSNNTTYGVDLNRNYSYGWGGPGSSSSPGSDIYRGEEPFSEPETSAVKTFIEQNTNIKIILSFHTYSELILYPWGHQNEGVGGDDQKVFETMAQTMAAWNGYRPKQASGLYIASGDTCDWAYGEHKIFCFTFELTPRYSWGPFGFYPGPKVIQPTFQTNIKPALYLIEKSKDPYQVLLR